MTRISVLLQEVVLKIWHVFSHIHICYNFMYYLQYQCQINLAPDFVCEPLDILHKYDCNWVNYLHYALSLCDCYANNITCFTDTSRDIDPPQESSQTQA